MKKRLAGRIALITGASRGLGAALAERFAVEGARLILVARNAEALEEVDDKVQAAGGEATLAPLDLTQHDKIDELAVQISKKFGKLDILVGNAAMLGTLTPVQDIKPREFAQVMALNAAANYRLIRAFHNGLLASGSGRVIFTTSGVTEFNPAFWGSYSISKAAMESIALTYAAETENSTIRVNIVNPGIFQSDLRAEAFPGENPEKLPAPETITNIFVDLARVECTQHGEKIRATNMAIAF
ncbi:MAG: SDR family NAD(P)-dependent oxidoreductase [Dongiaceae bacterium]